MPKPVPVAPRTAATIAARNFPRSANVGANELGLLSFMFVTVPLNIPLQRSPANSPGPLQGAPKQPGQIIERPGVTGKSIELKNSAGRIRTYAESVETPDNSAPASLAQPNAQPSFARDADLSFLLQHWDSLSEPIKLAVMALVRTAAEREAK